MAFTLGFPARSGLNAVFFDLPTRAPFLFIPASSRPDSAPRREKKGKSVPPMTHYLTVLSIAGSDPSGGAGIQADIKTMSALGVYAAAAVTAITVQNTRGVSRVVEVAPDVVAAQIEAVMTDLHPRVVKIGMTGSAALQQAVCQALEQAADDNPEVVADPVLRSSSGTDLMPPEAQLYYTRHMVPRAALLTPNLPEAAVLTGMARVSTPAEVRLAAKRLLGMGPRAVLMKGGHGSGNVKQDVLFWHEGGALRSAAFTAPAVTTRNTHGTGCALASAIAAYRARGLTWPDAVARAKHYVTLALQAGAGVWAGHGAGGINHLFSPEPLILQKS